MKWNRLFLVVIGSRGNNALVDEADDYLPFDYKFLETNMKGFLNFRMDTRATKYTQLSATSLSDVTLGDKLIIVAHGTSTGIIHSGGEWDAEGMLNALKGWGLKKAGLITFHCCNVGLGDFLEKFSAELDFDPDVEVGWLKGYKGYAKVTTKATDTNPKKPTQAIYRDEACAELLTGDNRFKVVRGNAEQVNVPNPQVNRMRYV
jgi:hypothetical protein